jgi:hypothetical protein
MDEKLYEVTWAVTGEVWCSIDCESDEQACKIRDQIAADRNAL